MILYLIIVDIVDVWSDIIINSNISILHKTGIKGGGVLLSPHENLLTSGGH